MKQTFRLLMLALPMLLGLASCSDSDDTADQNPLAKQVSGLWWALTDQEGTFGERDYTRIGQAICFEEDGTGYGITFFFNNLSADPIANLGGRGVDKFTYTTTQDGRIMLNLTDAERNAANFFSQWTVTYAGDKVSVTATDGQTLFTLEQPGESMAARIREWDGQMNGGLDAENYNINDYPIDYAGGTAVPFTAQNWRQQGAIFLYVGGTGDPSIHDTHGRTGYRTVNLPWDTTSGKQSNLPMNFCNDITPEEGWQLVFNNCGNRNVVNGNFFALYNKWTGVLRFFTFTPAEFKSGNDHLWEVTINGQTGMRQGLPYGLPLDASVVDPTAIGMDTGGSAHYVSPWVGSRSSDGLITPNVGWWAFDIDMSQYQPGLDITKDEIRLQMRSWKKENASFFSELEAGLNGTIDAQIKTELTKKASQLTKYNETMQIITSVGAIAGSLAGENPNAGSAFTAIGSMVDHMTTLAGKNEGKTTFRGSINMTMKGSISTSGIISGSDPVSLVASPTFALSMFDTENTQFGKGVWNLKTSPVVWVTDMGGSFDLRGYWAQNNPELVYVYQKQLATIAYYPDGGKCYFFDPSSIEVELNPDLFPESEVEWTRVEAYCVSRAENGVRGTDNYRKALGLQPRCGKLFDYSNSGIEDKDASHRYFDRNKNVFDFLYYSDDKWGLEYPAIVSTTKYEGGRFYDNTTANGYYDVVMGRGRAGGVAIEPVALHDGRNDVDLGYFERTPALEVMVCLSVKLKGQSEPFSYVRNFLPEIKPLAVYPSNWEDDYQTRVMAPMNQLWQNLKAKQPKGTGINRKSPTYDYEMERIGKILEFLNSDFKAE